MLPARGTSKFFGETRQKFGGQVRGFLRMRVTSRRISSNIGIASQGMSWKGDLKV